MAKLSNNVEYFNPNFQECFGEFLLSNQFSCVAGNKTLHFTRDNIKVVVYNDNIDVFNYKPELPGEEKLKWVFTGSFTDLKTLDFFGFISLMHDMHVVSVLRFLKDEKQKGDQFYTEAKLILNHVI